MHPTQVPTGAPLRTKQRTHLPALDGIRGVAILMVLAHNFGMLVAPRDSIAYLFQLGMDLGWVGVELFFVLSGYLITRILLETKASANYYRAFYMRRVLRIFPMYYGALLLLLVASVMFGGGAGSVEAGHGGSTIWYWLFLSNWIHPFAELPGAFPHFWSLAVEEQFYLLWPLVIRANSSQRIATFCVVLIIAAFGIRCGLLGLGINEEAVYSISICRMDALAVGALVAAIERNHNLWKIVSGISPWTPMIWAVLLFSVGLLIVQGAYPRTKYETQTFGYTLLAVVFGLVVLSVILAERKKDAGQTAMLAEVFSWMPLRALGKYSYGIYVIHKPLYDGVAVPWLATHGLLTTSRLWLALFLMTLMIGACFVLEWVIYHIYERRFLALKTRFNY